MNTWKVAWRNHDAVEMLDASVWAKEGNVSTLEDRVLIVLAF